jgi:hypothetical protein
MLAAVVRGNPEEVRKYIEDSGFDVNAADTGLHGNTGERVSKRRDFWMLLFFSPLSLNKSLFE